MDPIWAGETDVRAETLESAAQLLMLRRDTLRIIDGAGPAISASPSESTAEAHARPAEAERLEMVEQASSAQNAHATSRDAVGDSARPAKPTKCMFSGVVPIELQRFLDSGVALVECPDCASTRTLEPHRGVLRFKSHDKRKTTTPNTEPRWAKGETDWDVVGEESK